ncbi:hypothetical protein E2C01_063597 [Portunus trituberculatus]|uniref:Uncharacterized protein n=1 Tax=Portunus trituberculatus TaxID=210409 RepID=A0A5B7HLB6_PORTR|nr:hypothetical protein [Portunus trituberculatus]
MPYKSLVTQFLPVRGVHGTHGAQFPRAAPYRSAVPAAGATACPRPPHSRRLPPADCEAAAAHPPHVAATPPVVGFSAGAPEICPALSGCPSSPPASLPPSSLKKPSLPCHNPRTPSPRLPPHTPSRRPCVVAAGDKLRGQHDPFLGVFGGPGRVLKRCVS